MRDAGREKHHVEVNTPPAKWIYLLLMSSPAQARLSKQIQRGKNMHG